MPVTVFAAMMSPVVAGVTESAAAVLSRTSVATSDDRANDSVSSIMKTTIGRIRSRIGTCAPARSVPRIISDCCGHRDRRLVAGQRVGQLAHERRDRASQLLGVSGET